MPAADPNAHSRVQRALKSGKLVRPDRCERCGAADVRLRDGRSGLHAHHADYSRPLDVEWLCVTCHLGVRGKASRRIHVIMEPEFRDRIDAAATAAGVSRGEFVRRAVERALEILEASDPGSRVSAAPAPAEQSGVVEQASVTGVGGGSPGVSKAGLPAPAERPGPEGRQGYDRVSSAQSKRAVRPMPKAG